MNLSVMQHDAPPRLLVVDDDPVLAEALERGFARRGFAVVVASTFAQAVEAIEAEARGFDFAVLDLRLPGGHGLQLVPMLRNAHPRARIVMLTGYGSVPTAIDAIKRGATYYLAKPVDIDDILAAFEHDVDRHEAVLDATPMSLTRLEWEHIQRVLHDHGGNVSAAARALSMHRRTLQRKLAKHPVRR